LAKEPGQRPDSASALARELAGCAEPWTDEDLTAWSLPDEAYAELPFQDPFATIASTWAGGR